MAVTTVGNEGKGWLSFAITGVAAATAGGIAAIFNPEGVDLLITRTVLHISTNSTGAADLSSGVAASATTASTDIINALAMAAAAGKYYNGATIQTVTKTEISVPAIWESDEYVVVSGSATTVGLVGTMYIEYLRV